LEHPELTVDIARFTVDRRVLRCQKVTVEAGVLRAYNRARNVKVFIANIGKGVSDRITIALFIALEELVLVAFPHGVLKTYGFEVGEQFGQLIGLSILRFNAGNQVLEYVRVLRHVDPTLQLAFLALLPRLFDQFLSPRILLPLIQASF
jgi:hypothetical protein